MPQEVEAEKENAKKEVEVGTIPETKEVGAEMDAVEVAAVIVAIVGMTVVARTAERIEDLKRSAKARKGLLTSQGEI